MTTNYKLELECATEAAIMAGALLRNAFHLPETTAEDHDRSAEQQIFQFLFRSFPRYGYRGEELGLLKHPQDDAQHLWLVDPNDGTSAFRDGFRGASVSIALLRQGRPVLGVVYAYCAPDDHGDLFTWAEGEGPVRRNRDPISLDRSTVPGTILVAHHADRQSNAYATLSAPYRFRAVPSIAYRLALVAAGEAQVAVSLNGPVGWDYAGGHALLLGAGMDLFDKGASRITYSPLGDSYCLGRCFGGFTTQAREVAKRDWTDIRRSSAGIASPFAMCWPARGATVADSAVLARAQGCLLGQLAGDDLGSLVEFKSASAIRKLYPDGVRVLRDGGVWNTLAGQPTDDSEMALMLARSIVDRGRFDPEDAANVYVWWYESSPFDIGTTTSAALRAAARAAKAGQPASDAARIAARPDSQANGGLMRISPLAIFAAGAEARVGGELAMQDTGLTHPNPVCLHASRVFVESIAFAIRSGADPRDVYDFAVLTAHLGSAPASVSAAIANAANERPADYMANQGWVLIALQNAFWQLLHADSAEDGIIDTVMAGGDTDTNGAIAGALLGAVYGRDGIPMQWRDRVLTCRPIAGAPGVYKPRPRPFWPVDALWLAERLLFLGRAG